MICKHCKKLYSDDTAVCPFCGQAQDETSTPTVTPPSAAAGSPFRKAGDLSGSTSVAHGSNPTEPPIDTPPETQIHTPPEAQVHTPPTYTPPTYTPPTYTPPTYTPPTHTPPTYTPPGYTPPGYPTYPPASSAPESAGTMINFISLSLVVISIILWFVAPFMFVNIFTLNNQPSALELLQEDVLHIGDLTETPAYTGAIVSIVGLVVCAICILCKSQIVTRIAAGATLALLIYPVVDFLQEITDFEELTAVFGSSFFCIIISLIIVAILGGSMKKPR